MARQARKLSSTLTYHVIVRGADRQLLFEETKDYLKFLDFLQLYKEKYAFEKNLQEVNLVKNSTRTFLTNSFSALQTYCCLTYYVYMYVLFSFLC